MSSPGTKFYLIIFIMRRPITIVYEADYRLAQREDSMVIDIVDTFGLHHINNFTLPAYEAHLKRILSH
jgi:hypothetical protein